MRKRLITPTPETIRTREEGWLDVERTAVVEVTSEHENFSCRIGIRVSETRGWRAEVLGVVHASTD